ncbi:MAG: acyltransferase, partial [Synergistaceae bacterium]|nr:acyltransferase [Synergistaceae bacterium]
MKNRAIIGQIRPDHSIIRNSSLELLRIVAMLAIIAHHFSVHGGFNFPVSSITFNRLWQQFILMGGGLGNCIFVMLSGYFLINSKGLSFRKLFNLWTRIFFWSVTIYYVFVLSGHEVFALKSTLKALLPVTRRQWWFASTYFVMYLIHPYVNKFLHGLTREEYKKFLLSVMILWCIIPTLTKSDFGANPTINFVCIYSLAGYVRLYGDDFVERKYILWALAFIGLNFLSAIVIDVIGLKFSFVKSRSYSYMFSMMRPFTIAATVC